jgi:poly(3-hydroxybutyrate) depolymerase
MPKYIGVKLVEATPMTHGEFRDAKGHDVPDHPGDEGYMVVYPDGYESWCPKAQFEEANTAIPDTMADDAENLTDIARRKVQYLLTPQEHL